MPPIAIFLQTLRRAVRSAPALAHLPSAYPPKLWPMRTGTASIRCVRPSLTMPSKSFASFRATSPAGPARLQVAMDRQQRGEVEVVGMMSFEDWPHIGRGRSGGSACRRRAGAGLLVAEVREDSFAFMLVEVPDPVWKTSMGNSASRRPRRRRAQASWIILQSSRGHAAGLRARLTSAQRS